MRTTPLVLIIDDEDMFLEIASMKLRSEGFETVLTKDFQEAINKAETLQPDLVLSDIYMPPGPSGWDLALELRRNPKTKTVKLAFFTSLRDPWIELKTDRKLAAAELGNIRFLSKTDDVDILAEEVASIIKG